MKLKISIALNVVLIAIVAVHVVREELRKIDEAVAAHYFPKKKFAAFEAPIRQPMPDRFEYRLRAPDQPPEPTR